MRISVVKRHLYASEGPVKMAAKGLLRHNDPAHTCGCVSQNAELKYSGNVRERESRYSIITRLLQLIPAAVFQSFRKSVSVAR